MFTTILAQTIPLPDTFEALLWIIITVLASINIYLFRQLRKSDERNVVFQTTMQEKVLAGLSENSEAMRGLANVIEAMQEQFSLRKEIESLRREIRNESSKKS